MPLKIIPMPGMNRFEKTLPAMSCSVVVTDCLADQASPPPHLFNKSAPHAQRHYNWPHSQSWYKHLQSKEGHSQALKGKAVIIVTRQFLPALLLRLQEVLYRLRFVNQSVKRGKAKNSQGRYLAERGEMERVFVCWLCKKGSIRSTWNNTSHCRKYIARFLSSPFSFHWFQSNFRCL